MKLLTVRCNECGAPLEVAPSAKFVTCGFCSAQLAVHRTGSSASTELLQEIKQTTDGLVRDVADLKKSSDLEQLDRQWEKRQSELMIRSKHGRVSKPSSSSAMVTTGFGVAFGLFWMVMAGGIASGASRTGMPGIFRIFPLFGLVFIAFAVFAGMTQHRKAQQLEQARDKYQRQRSELLESGSMDSSSPSEDASR